MPMYLALAVKFDASHPEVAAILRSMAADEGRHASVIKELSGLTLKPRKTLARVVPALLGLIGPRKTFEIIAKSEYAAFDNYAPWVDKYPTIASVQADERKHGDLCHRIIDLLGICP